MLQGVVQVNIRKADLTFHIIQYRGDGKVLVAIVVQISRLNDGFRELQLLFVGFYAETHSCGTVAHVMQNNVVILFPHVPGTYDIQPAVIVNISYVSAARAPEVEVAGIAIPVGKGKVRHCECAVSCPQEDALLAIGSIRIRIILKGNYIHLTVVVDIARDDRRGVGYLERGLGADLVPPVCRRQV